MQRIEWFIVLVILALQAEAVNFITIPDSSFRAALKELYPACFNTSGQMILTRKKQLMYLKIN